MHTHCLLIHREVSKYTLQPDPPRPHPIKECIITRTTGQTTGQSTAEGAKGRELGHESTGKSLLSARQERRASVDERSHATGRSLQLLGDELVDELAGG